MGIHINLQRSETITQWGRYTKKMEDIRGSDDAYNVGTKCHLSVYLFVYEQGQRCSLFIYVLFTMICSFVLPLFKIS